MSTANSQLGNAVETVAVIFSGGLDSAVVIAHELSKGNKVVPLVFDDGCIEYQAKTRVAIADFLIHYGLYGARKEIRIYDTESIMGQDDFGFIPGWKMNIQVGAMAYCQALGIKKCYFGYNEGNFDQIYDDERPEHIDAITNLYNLIYKTDIQVLSPFYTKTKTDMVILGDSLGVPFDKTLSCAKLSTTGTEHCGKCELCRRRIEAFHNAGLRDTANFRVRDHFPQYLEVGAYPL